ncbi:MAG TPA: ribonuclease D [Thermoanaerobaculia bacterium]|nr:ribonuclease D [Thermoanaerobaculia bacterium]
MTESNRNRSPYSLIESDSDLAAAVRRWKELPALGLDTEFVRERTFFHRLGLIQVADGEAVYLIDPLKVTDLAPLAEVLRAPGTVKVLHSASEDVEVFYRGLGAVPEPLFDTQVAAALAGAGAFLSYQKLVSALFGVELPKGETRTDWLARPLSEAQLTYAAEDVAFLLPLYERLRHDLSALGRLPWALEDSAALLDTGRFEEDLDAAWLRIKGAGRLNRRQLAALQALAAWREREARQRDLPRNFVLKEGLLLALATRRPATPREVRKLPDFDAGQAARDETTWLETLHQTESLPEDALPSRVSQTPFSPGLKELSQRLRERARQTAEALGIPPEILAPRRTLDALLRRALDPDPRLPPDLQGWRREVVGEDLLSEVRAARIAPLPEASDYETS